MQHPMATRSGFALDGNPAQLQSPSDLFTDTEHLQSSPLLLKSRKGQRFKVT